MTTKTFCDICQKEVKEGHSLSTYREDLLVEELDLCKHCFNKFHKLLELLQTAMSKAEEKNWYLAKVAKK